MSTPFLPSVGASANTWGTLLNNWLGVAHNPDGTLMNMALTTVQTANCTALANQIVPVDTTSGSIDFGDASVTFDTVTVTGTVATSDVRAKDETEFWPSSVKIKGSGIGMQSP